VAERRIPPDRQNGGSEGALIRQAAVPDRVDPAVEGMEAAGPDPIADIRRREPKPMELGRRDDPVLAFGDPRESSIQGCLSFR
jgi:hypothetical protein